ncbi:DUF423 domain-containing protein [Lutimonas sp.]|jgi:uncharacterized membrane protein YgdD (TMEM256/DUF423 family)|uniref:DUF423 domain-containing protein n=1 Tax=Lutimonas sp. TaxID=1872403 RepID=UPI003C7830C1
MTRIYPAIAASLGMLTIILGAFGAHALKDQLEPESLQSFETGVRYMMFHVLAILLINFSPLLSQRSKTRISQLFLIGILLFSGSIFVIATGLIQAKTIWFITPLGGLFFVLGWLIATLSFLKSNDKN